MRKHFPVLLSLFWMAQFSFAQAIKSNKNPPVQIKATASKPDADGRQKVTLHVKIAKGLCIYANSVGSEIFQPGATKVSFNMKNGDKVFATVKYPKGVRRRNEVVGHYDVYEGGIIIHAIVERKQISEPLRITLSCFGFWKTH